MDDVLLIDDGEEMQGNAEYHIQYNTAIYKLDKQRVRHRP